VVNKILIKMNKVKLKLICFLNAEEDKLSMQKSFMSAINTDTSDITHQSDGIIRVGDVVYLWADVAGGGCLSADGLDPECRVVAHHETDSLPLDCLFELRIQHNYKAQRILTQELSVSNDFGDDTTRHKEPRRIQLEHDAKEEIHRNMYETNRSVGNPVTFGQVVQFFHVKSGMLLSLRTGDSDEMLDNCEAQAHHVQISAKGSECAWLRIESRYKIRQVGDPVHYWDTVCLAGENNLMLSCCSEPLYDVAIGNQAAPSFSLHTSTDKFPWKLRLFRANSIRGHQNNALEAPIAVSNKDFVKGGDVLRLMHTDIQAYLSFDKLAFTEHKDSVVLSSNHVLPVNDNISSVDSIPSFSLWRLELEDGTSGSIASLKCACRLQHLVTKQYLSFSQEGTSPRFTLISSPNHTTVFLMEPVFMTEGLLKWQGCIHLQHRISGVYLHAEKNVAVASNVLLRQDAFSIEQVQSHFNVICTHS
jgi:hypothetical protein